MSDARLRGLERRWRETGVMADEATFLLERLRVGELTQERLQLAAYLGYEAAKVVLETDAPLVPEDSEDWVNGLKLWGKEACVRAAIVIAEAVQGLPGALISSDEWSEWAIPEAIRAASKWVFCQTEKNAGDAFTRGRLVIPDNFNARLFYPDTPAAQAAFAASMPINRNPNLRQYGDMPTTAIAFVRRSFNLSVVRSICQNISAELLPWVLGTGDALRDRVEERARILQQEEVRDDVRELIEIND